MGRLEGKVAIVTGSGQGIGRAVALAFANEGAKVVVAEIQVGAANATAQEIRDQGKPALAAVCDVGHEEQVKKMVEQAVAEFGPIDILVNVAQAYGPKGYYGPFPEKPVEECPEENWDNTFQTGVKASWYTMKAVFPHMKERGGKIVNFGSRVGIEGQAGMVDYAANKEAIRSLSRVAAREWAKYKINVNVVTPAALTGASKAWAEAFPEKYKQSVQGIPLGRLGDPEKDIAPAVVFLASADSDYITGITLPVQGGLGLHA